MEIQVESWKYFFVLQLCMEDKAASLFGKIQYNLEEKNQIASALQKKLQSGDVATRPGPRGISWFKFIKGEDCTYLETYHAIELANEVFGFNGWSSSIISLNPDFVIFPSCNSQLEEEKGKFKCGVTALIRITLRDGTYHEVVLLLQFLS